MMRGTTRTVVRALRRNRDPLARPDEEPTFLILTALASGPQHG